MPTEFHPCGGNMDRRRNQPVRASSKAVIAARLQLIRVEIYGEAGCPEIAGQLGLPLRTWINYESGVVIPGDVLLCFLELTGTEPLWLLSGAGAKFRVLALKDS